MPRSRPYGLVSEVMGSPAPGWPRSKVAFRCSLNAASPASAEPSPYTLGLGLSGNGVQYSRASRMVSRRLADAPDPATLDPAESLPRAAVEELQLERLRETLRRAYAH